MSAAGRWRGGAALALGVLAGCSSVAPAGPSFRASWYLQEAASAPQAATVFLGLLNDGTTTIELRQVIVNPEGGAAGPPGASNGRMEVVDGKGTRWPAAGLGSESQGRPWRPGELLVFRVRSKVADDRCSLPVLVQIECGAGCRRTEAVSGALPNYLRPQWIDHCGPNSQELTP